MENLANIVATNQNPTPVTPTAKDVQDTRKPDDASVKTELPVEQAAQQPEPTARKQPTNPIFGSASLEKSGEDYRFRIKNNEGLTVKYVPASDMNDVAKANWYESIGTTIDIFS